MAGFDRRLFSYRQLGFGRRERFTDPAPARILVRFPDGAIADSSAMPGHRTPPGAVVLRQCAASAAPDAADDARYGWQESQWRVCWPQPPDGRLRFVVYLRGSTQPAGTGEIDAQRVLGHA